MQRIGRLVSYTEIHNTGAYWRPAAWPFCRDFIWNPKFVWHPQYRPTVDLKLSPVSIERLICHTHAAILGDSQTRARQHLLSWVSQSLVNDCQMGTSNNGNDNDSDSDTSDYSCTFAQSKPGLLMDGLAGELRSNFLQSSSWWRQLVLEHSDNYLTANLLNLLHTIAVFEQDITPMVASYRVSLTDDTEQELDAWSARRAALLKTTELSVRTSLVDAEERVEYIRLYLNRAEVVRDLLHFVNLKVLLLRRYVYSGPNPPPSPPGDLFLTRITPPPRSGVREGEMTKLFAGIRLLRHTARENGWEAVDYKVYRDRKDSRDGGRHSRSLVNVVSSSEDDQAMDRLIAAYMHPLPLSVLGDDWYPHKSKGEPDRDNQDNEDDLCSPCDEFAAEDASIDRIATSGKRVDEPETWESLFRDHDEPQPWIFHDKKLERIEKEEERLAIQIPKAYDALVKELVGVLDPAQGPLSLSPGIQAASTTSQDGANDGAAPSFDLENPGSPKEFLWEVRELQDDCTAFALGCLKARDLEGEDEDTILARLPSKNLSKLAVERLLKNDVFVRRRQKSLKRRAPEDEHNGRSEKAMKTEETADEAADGTDEFDLGEYVGDQNMEDVLDEEDVDNAPSFSQIKTKLTPGSRPGRSENVSIRVTRSRASRLK